MGMGMGMGKVDITFDALSVFGVNATGQVNCRRTTYLVFGLHRVAELVVEGIPAALSVGGSSQDS